MSVEENKTLVRLVFENVINLRDWGLADKIVASSYFDHLAPPNRAHGPASIKDFARLQRERYPDTHITVEDIIGEDDRVAARIRMTGTSVRSGAPVEFRGTVWWRCADGMIIERWGAVFARTETI